jgi:hypothetical protein
MDNIDNMKPDLFSEGLKKFFTKGSIVEPVRLNKRMKEIILLLIEEDLENSIILYPEEDYRYNRFMKSMDWLKQRVTGIKNNKQTFNIKIGATLYYWMCNKDFHYLSDDKDFDKAMQWILNHINKKWSVSELANK